MKKDTTKKIEINSTIIYKFDFDDFFILFDEEENSWKASHKDIVYDEDYLIEYQDELNMTEEKEILLWGYYLFTEKDLKGLKKHVKNLKDKDKMLTSFKII